MRRSLNYGSFKSRSTVDWHHIPNKIDGAMLVNMLFKNVICVNTTNAPVNIAKHAQNPAKNINTFTPSIPKSLSISFIFIPPLFKNNILFLIIRHILFAKKKKSTKFL